MSSDRADVDLAAEVEQKTSPMAELGVTGLRRHTGYLDEEFLPALKGPKAVKVYREMSDNDPIVGAMEFAVKRLVGNVDWIVKPGGKSKEHAEAAKLVETCMEDMSHSWSSMVQEILSCTTYGWSWHEIVYKRRMGPWERDGAKRSKYTDGLIGWRKIPIRSQDSLQRWAFDESGSVKAMIQLAPPDYQTRVLPIERSLLFRYQEFRGSPEGRSMLRNAYRPYFYLKRLQEYEAIGVERDLAGLPMVKVPMAWLKARPGTEQHKQVEAFKKMVRGIRRNEQEGIVFPQGYDAETKQELFSFELLGSGGARQFQTDPLIQRYEQRILMTVLADFIMVGHQRVGSYNLHLDKTGIFRSALNNLSNMIADTFNRHAIPRLFALNGWKPAELPTIVAQDVDAPDLTQLAGFLAQTAGLGFTWGPDADIEKFLRQAAGLPEMGEDDLKKERTFARREEATRFAESQTRYLATRSALAQQVAASQMQAQGQPALEDEQAAQGVAQGQMAQQQQAETHQTTQAGAQLTQAQQAKELATPPERKTGGKK